MARKQNTIKRKDLKEDPLMTAIAEGQQWLGENGTRLAVVAVVIGLVVVGGWFYAQMRASAEEEAAAALMEVGRTVSGNTVEELMPPIREVAESFEGTNAGAEAQFGLGQLAMQNGDYQAAVDDFTTFLSEYKSVWMLEAAARLGRATAYENMEQYDNAAADYELLLDNKQASHIRVYALLGAARCLEKSGDIEGARSYYTEASEIDDAPDAAKERAKLSLELLASTE